MMGLIENAGAGRKKGEAGRMDFIFKIRVPWKKFFLLWALALLMGGSVFWLHWGFSARTLYYLMALAGTVGMGLLWATSRPYWEKAYCSWCGGRVNAQSSRWDEKRCGLIYLYPCPSCGQVSEKLKLDSNQKESSAL